MEACRRLKGLPSRVFDQPPISNLESAVIHHEKIRGLQASIRPLQVGGAPLSPPMFLIRLERREDFAGEKDAAAGKLELWANLSPSEQHVAWLASQGHRNAEIAGQLNKSVLTVKKQLQCIYHKLEVSGRGRLIALFN
jgi:DNA-binding CsgD family transcriptional regulator